ncbi:MAG: DUF4160 domain-containing protein [Bacillota bacterium]
MPPHFHVEYGDYHAVVDILLFNVELD